MAPFGIISSKCAEESSENFGVSTPVGAIFFWELYSFLVGSLKKFNQRSYFLNLRKHTWITARAVKAHDYYVFNVGSGFESWRAESGEIRRTSHEALPPLS